MTTEDEPFKKLDTCDDEGKIEQHQCDKIVCTTYGGYERSFRTLQIDKDNLYYRIDNTRDLENTMETAAVIECENEYYIRPVYFHSNHFTDIR